MSPQIVETAHSVDIHLFNREGCLEGHGMRGRCSWENNVTGEETASIGWAYVGPNAEGNSIDFEALILFYTVTPASGGDPYRMKYAVEIDRTECNFGGTRPWLLCPRCDDRVAKIYQTATYDRWVCRDCAGLIYRSQTNRSALIEAFERLDEAKERIEEEPLNREALREFYDAQQNVNVAYRTHLEHFDDTYGNLYDDETRVEQFGREDLVNLPPFEEWLDDLFAKTFGSPGGRHYGYHGRCTATAKTTGERCRQPARGEHRKCYFHGGADGSGVGDEQIDRQAERFREFIEEVEQRRERDRERTEETLS